MDDSSSKSDAPGEPAPQSVAPAPVGVTLPIWKRPVMVLALFSAAVGGGALAGVLGSGLSPAAVIAGAVSNTLSQQTAHLHFTETLASNSGRTSVGGSGSIDFANGAAREVVTEPVMGEVLTFHIVYLGAFVYVQIPQLAEIDPGKSWVSIDRSALTRDGRASGLESLGADPAAGLRLLSTHGVAFDALGPSSVDGQSVRGYGVDYNIGAIEHTIGSGLPAWMQDAIKSVPFTYESSAVYVNGADEVVRMTNATGLSGSGGSGTVRGSIDFSDYGAPVSITAPPSDQVVSFSQFLESVGESSPA